MILLTGATGDLGSKLLVALQRLNIDVVCISRKSGIGFINMDLSKSNIDYSELLNLNITTVIHLAFDKFDFSKSLLMTKNIVNISNKINSIKTLMFCSSWCSYLPERNMYSKYKYDSEKYITKYCTKNHIIFRPTVIVGKN